MEFHVPLTNCFVRRWFCAVHGPKPPLHRHNWLSFGKFQDTECFLIHCARHFSSRLPPSSGTCKYAKAPSTKKKLWEILYLLICSFLAFLSWLLRSRVRKFQRDLWITLYVTQCETCMTGNDYGHPPSGTGRIIFSLQIWNKLNLRNCSKILMWTTVAIGTFMELWSFHASQAGNPS